MKKSSIIRFIAGSLCIVIFCFGAVTRLAQQLPSYLLAKHTFSQVIYDAKGNCLRITLASDQKFRVYHPLSEIDKKIQLATLLYEDRYFYWHFGINPFSLVRAFVSTYVTHQHKMGASTISMQVAKLVFHLDTRNLRGKLQQITYALLLETYYSKNQILEAYLNLAPYGNNIEGVGAASLLYFNKACAHLTQGQALALSLIPQSPTVRHIRRQTNPDLEQARLKLIHAWQRQYPQYPLLQNLVSLPVKSASQTVPFQAPHFSQAILQENSHIQALHTSLEITVQKALERELSSYVAHNRNLDVNNAAMLLVDTNSMQVKSYIGSANFYDGKIAGQVDGVRAKRSPGSTLKPFIYALAIQQGLIHSQSILKDVPSSFGEFNPENFDADFMGPISAEAALNHSRNIPAVYLATKLSKPDLYDFLQTAGVSPLQAREHYGLSLVLGGAEISLQELVGLYALFANHGNWYPLNFTSDSTRDASCAKQLLTPEAAYITKAMLQQHEPPGSFKGVHWQDDNIAWKTGTSSGYRDAWAVGVFGHYVLGVWVGNFAGQGNPNFIGQNTAAILLFRSIQMMQPLLDHHAPTLPAKKLNLKQLDVCPVSGKLPTSACPHTIKSWFIPGVSPIARDDIHQLILIDKKTNLRACHPSDMAELRLFESWPSDIAAIFQRAGLARMDIPPYMKACQMASQPVGGASPQITSPNEALVYLINRKQSATLTIPLIATVDGDVRRIYWFVNKVYIGESLAGKTLFWRAVSGTYHIHAIDDQGRVSSARLQVKAS